MGVYRKVCYKVEDLFIKILTKKEDPEEVKLKVSNYRDQKEKEKSLKREEIQAKQAKQKQLQNEKRAEQEKIRIARQEQEKKEILEILSKVVDVKTLSYSQYEYNEVKKNKQFFQSLFSRVFESDERGLSFIFCEFDKSSKKEIKGYLIATNKRVLFITPNFNFMDKFRYQTIINVNWFKDGLLEKGLKIQYGKRRLEFDEIYDTEQMKRIGNLILNLSVNK